MTTFYIHTNLELLGKLRAKDWQEAFKEFSECDLRFNPEVKWVALSTEKVIINE